jgi:N-glycosylase/DNA lyase
MLPRTLQAFDFDLDKTLNSGQVFHWVAHRGGFAGTIGDQLAYIEQVGETLLFAGGEESLVVRYFALDHPLNEILETFPNDPAVKLAKEYSAGIRIIRQPAWECLATFLTSAMKQVLHIRAISHAIRRRFGTRLQCGDLCAFSYPGPEILAAARWEELIECKLGFRARNLLSTAQMIAEGRIDLEALQNLSTEEARNSLLQLPGVGEKIANCVLLFAFERLEAVPIDVWIARVLNKAYFMGQSNVSMADLKVFAANYFGPYAGYAQQYLFHHWRSTYRKRG